MFFHPFLVFYPLGDMPVGEWHDVSRNQLGGGPQTVFSFYFCFPIAHGVISILKSFGDFILRLRSDAERRTQTNKHEMSRGQSSLKTLASSG